MQSAHDLILYLESVAGIVAGSTGAGEITAATAAPAPAPAPAPTPTEDVIPLNFNSIPDPPTGMPVDLKKFSVSDWFSVTISLLKQEFKRRINREIKTKRTGQMSVADKEVLQEFLATLQISEELRTEVMTGCFVSIKNRLYAQRSSSSPTKGAGTKRTQKIVKVDFTLPVQLNPSNEGVDRALKNLDVGTPTLLSVLVALPWLDIHFIQGMKLVQLKQSKPFLFTHEAVGEGGKRI